MKRFDAAFLVLSWVVMGFSFAFFVPMAWDWFGEGGDHVRVWGWCFLFTLATGGWLWVRTRHAHRELTVRDGFMLVTLFVIMRAGHQLSGALLLGARRAFGRGGAALIERMVAAVYGTVTGLVVVGLGEGAILGVAYALAGNTLAPRSERNMPQSELPGS